jgi:hypothetical protein
LGAFILYSKNNERKPKRKPIDKSMILYFYKNKNDPPDQLKGHWDYNRFPVMG